MKSLAAMVCLGVMGFANAQSTSRDVEIYERYENGELVEQRQSATENGVPIENFDFEQAKREMQMKSAEMERKMEEMMTGFDQKFTAFQSSMDEKMKSFDQKMSDFEKRSEEMHQKMDQRLKEMEEKREQKPEAPAKVEQTVVGESTEHIKFT